MSPTIQDLGIDHLNAETRLRLIGEIWDSLSQDEQVTMSDAQREELDRRIAEADTHPEEGRPWEEVRARLRDGR